MTTRLHQRERTEKFISRFSRLKREIHINAMLLSRGVNRSEESDIFQEGLVVKPYSRGKFSRKRNFVNIYLAKCSYELNVSTDIINYHVLFPYLSLTLSNFNEMTFSMIHTDKYFSEFGFN